MTFAVTGATRRVGSRVVRRLLGCDYVPLADVGYRSRLAADRTPDWLIEAYAFLFTSVREDRFAAVSTDVTTLTGLPAGSCASSASSLGPRLGEPCADSSAG